MYEVIRLIHLADGTDAGAWARRLPGVAAGAVTELAEPTLAGSRNGGDVLWRLSFADQGAWRATESAVDDVLTESVTHVDGAEYTTDSPTTTGRRSDEAGTVYRTLLMRADPSAPEATRAQFERETLGMPGHLPGMTAWRLARVDRAIGASGWTHVWEQEFATLADLTGAYMMHPIHWGSIDRWFDPESPDHLVRDRVCHSFCENTTGRALIS